MNETRTRFAFAAALFALAAVVPAAEAQTDPSVAVPSIESPTERAGRWIDEGRPAEAIPLLVDILDQSVWDDAARDALKRALMHPDVTPGATSRAARRLLRSLATTASTSLVPAGEPGESMLVSGRVIDEQGRPIVGALIYAFQADAEGKYTKGRAMDEPNARLFGFMRTGADGAYEVATIWPGAYAARPDLDGDARFIPRHIHFEVSAAGYATVRQQLVFTDDERMTRYWYEWARKWGHPVVGVVHEGGAPRRAVNDIVLVRRGQA